MGDNPLVKAHGLSPCTGRQNMVLLLLNWPTHEIRVHYTYTVNSEIFLSIIFSRTSHIRSFMKIEPSRNGEITIALTDVLVINFDVTNMNFRAFPENNILAKIS